MAMRSKRALWVGAAIVALVALVLYRHFDLGRLLTLDSLKASRDGLVAAYQAQPLFSAAAFFGLYVLAAALSIPGATILTLAAGAMFGLGVGLGVARSARVEGYGLAELGIALTARKTIAVDAWVRTRYPNIYAVGDVAGPYQLTHAAAHQAWHTAVNALFGRFRRFKADDSVMPWTTFTDPEVARVGLSETEASEQGIAVEVTRYGLDDLDRAIADGTAHGLVKVLTVPGKDKILGVTIVGEHADDLLAEHSLATKHGLGLNQILSTIHTYPTLAEANKYAAGAWKRAHAPRRLLAWAEHFHQWERA